MHSNHDEDNIECDFSLDDDFTNYDELQNEMCDEAMLPSESAMKIFDENQQDQQVPIFYIHDEDLAILDDYTDNDFDADVCKST